MSRPIVIIASLFFMLGLCRADEIYFYSGKIWKNCEVKGRTGGQIEVTIFTKEAVLSGNSFVVRKTKDVPEWDVFKTVTSPFDSDNETTFSDGQRMERLPAQVYQSPTKTTESVVPILTPKTATLEMLWGFGLHGLYKSNALCYAFTTGLIKENHGILFTLSYGAEGHEIHLAGFSTKYLFNIQNHVYVGICPEVHITILGLMKLNAGASVQFNLIGDVIASIGYSGFDGLNLEAMVSM